MKLSAEQSKFLDEEFGVLESQLYGLEPLPLWRLREDCIGIECDEAEEYPESVTERGNLAASIVDLVSSLLPKEWKRKTPPEVEAMYPGAMSEGAFFKSRIPALV
jgi:hypothetical protein